MAPSKLNLWPILPNSRSSNEAEQASIKMREAEQKKREAQALKTSESIKDKISILFYTFELGWKQEEGDWTQDCWCCECHSGFRANEERKKDYGK